ncbi:LOW QUALITY PROTEIN: uncharacterized protein [Lepeophtheirus salmonis]|uniref:LOW QUALITY PROTEIN: uncharacterized protein n=1 Tax=Lepeophtheirus salmonis TaxID=72036 RepID=UPI003AF3FBAE
MESNGNPSRQHFKPPPNRPPPPIVPPPIAPGSPMVSRKTRNSSAERFNPVRRTPPKHPLFNNNGNNNGSSSRGSSCEVHGPSTVEQFEQQKVFLQNALKDKENLSIVCSNQSAKLNKLESERNEWQRKIIETEREKRDLMDRITQEGSQSLKKIEKQKRDHEKIQTECTVIMKERNDAINQISSDMKEIERLEQERVQLYGRIDALERERSAEKPPPPPPPSSQNEFLKLKSSLSQISSENNELRKQLSDSIRDKEIVAEKLHCAIKSKESLSSELKETLTNSSSQTLEFSKQINDVKRTENNLKIEITKLKKENLLISEDFIKVKDELHKSDRLKRDATSQIETLSNEIRSLRAAKESKDRDLKKIECSQTDIAESNVRLLKEIEDAKSLIKSSQNENDKLHLEFINFKSSSDDKIKSLESQIKSNQGQELERNSLIRDLKNKIEKFENEKKNVIKSEKTKRDSVHQRLETEKKEAEDKLEKMRIQFEKIAIESKRKMTQLEDDRNTHQSYISEFKANLEKKDEENRSLQKKYSILQNECNKFKNTSKTDIARVEKEVEDTENRLNDSRRKCDNFQKQIESLSLTSSKLKDEKDKYEKRIFELEKDVATKNKEFNSKESQISADKRKIEKTLEDKSNKISLLQSEIESLTSKYEKENDYLNKCLKDMKDKLNQVQRKSNNMEQQYSNEMNSKVNNLNSTIENYKTQIRELNSERELLCSSSTEEKEKLQMSKDEEISNLQSKIEDFKKKLSSYSKKIKDLENVKKESEGIMQKASQENQSLIKKVSTLEGLSRRLEAEKNKAEKAIEEAGKSYKTLQSKFDKLTNEKMELNKKLEGFLKESKSGNDKTQKRTRDLEQRIKEKDNEISNKVREFDKERSDLKLQNQRDISEYIAKLNNLTKEKSETMTNLNNQTRKFQEERDTLQNKFKTEISTLKSKLESLKTDSNKAKKELESQLEKALAESHPSLEVELKRLIETGQLPPKIKSLIIELSTKAKPVNGEYPNLKIEKVEEIKVRLKEAEDKTSELSKALTETQGALKESQEENSKLSSSLEEKKSKKSSFICSRSSTTENEDRIKELEEALDTAVEERQELLEAAEKEIEYHRLIAAEIEQNMIDDFEWKLHEIESEYNKKFKSAVASSSGATQSTGAIPKTSVSSPGSAMYDVELFEKKLREATNEITRKKDEEFAKLHIQLRKETDDKLRLERNSLKTALDGVHSSELRKSNDEIKRTITREFSKQIESLQNEVSQYQSQISTLTLTIQKKDDEVIEARKLATQEGDEKAFKERRQANVLGEKYEHEKEKLEADYSKELATLREEHDRQIKNLEKRLEVALGAKLEHMEALREEVEEEYADRMETLRDMYQDELRNQTDSLKKEKDKFYSLEKSLQETLRMKRNEIERYSSLENDYKSEIDELKERLQKQTDEVLKLQTELNEYEYEDAL